MLAKETLPLLKEGKNLLAFSGGIDSSALFFLLMHEDIPFDIAIVDYRTRAQSAQEVAYARALAQEFAKECHLMEVQLPEQNFEANARRIRYDFFETLVAQHGYTCLITAHQLDDRLEWMLMQLTKGAGLYELLGAQTVEKRDGYQLVRPLLETSKAELKTYLDENDLRSYDDESNRDERYKRNFFRHNIASPLLKSYKSGIKKSFSYLNEDLTALYSDTSAVETIGQLHWFKHSGSRRSALIMADRVLKSQGFLMRQGDKERLKTEDEHVVGRRFVVAFHPDYCFIAPYVAGSMSKQFKERCRLLEIPKKLRPYLYENETGFNIVASLLNKS